MNKKDLQEVKLTLFSLLLSIIILAVVAFTALNLEQEEHPNLHPTVLEESFHE